MEVIAAHLPMCAGQQHRSSRDPPWPATCLPPARSSLTPGCCQPGTAGATHPPRPRWSATLSAPRDPSLSRPHHASCQHVTGTCHVFPSGPDGNHARHHPSSPIMARWTSWPTSSHLILNILNFKHLLPPIWRLFLCNLQVRISAAMECNTSIATLKHG